jgi:hypothetical protein
MAASKGVDNWNKNWKGSDRATVVKKSAPYYNYGETKSVGFLPIGANVVYIDALSESHTRVAIRYGKEVYYTNVDNLTKPKSLTTVNLQPQAFNIVGRELSVSEYVRELKNQIQTRADITGDLESYLLDLVNYSYTGTASFGGYDIGDLPLADIIKYFGEVLGPIHCLKRGLLNKFNLGISSSSKILIPTSTTEPLLDYYLIKPDGKRIPISAKATGTSNPLKVDIIVKKIKESSTLLRKYQNTVEFKILDAINNNTMMNGPFVGAMLLGEMKDTDAALAISLQGGVIQDPTPFQKLIKGDSRLSILPRNQKPTAMQLSYVCEKKIVQYSRANAGRFTNMIKDTLAEEIIFVKLSINPTTKTPQFEALKADGSYGIGLVKLRSKNGYASKSDKLGFQL